ncbi:MAG: sensor domain-containing diguanylate cyclase [Acidimicrobiia bacterium]|nr:sensor domain-containing diguanylate cyclase [Acidimicrobiia bacterium]
MGLAVLPLAGLTFFAWETVSPKLEAAEQSREVREGADLVGSLTQARYRIAVERIISLALSTADDLGLDDAQAEALYGRDLREELKVARGRVDDVVDALPSIARIDDPLSSLAAARRRFDAGHSTSDDLVARYEQVEIGMQAVVEEEAVDLDHLVASFSAFERMHDETSSLPVVADAVDAGLNQVVAIGLHLLRGGDQGRPWLLDLAVATDRYERDATALDRRLEGAARAEWITYVQSSGAVRLDEIVDGFLAGATGEPAGEELPDATTVFDASYERSESLIGVMDTAVASIRTGAVAAHRSATTDAERTRKLLMVLIGCTLAMTILSARSIGLSLRRLDEQARNVSSGALGTPLVDERGPREIAAVARALNELVVALRVAERQAAALADGQIDDESMSEAMPGALGGSLERAVDRLSASITEREELRERLAHEASHDSLTGLPNRAAALGALERAVARARRSGETVAVLFADLDGFKVVNDTRGHGAGDAVLVEVGRRLQRSVRDGDLVARLGGDEFVVIAEPVQDDREAVALAERLVEAVGSPVGLGEVQATVGLSVGVAVNSHPGLNADGLLNAADAAMYAAKAGGRGRVVLAGESPSRARA